MLHLSVRVGDGIPLYLQIEKQVKAMIASGRLRPHQELPPVRTLAKQLVVNPNTVVRAYRELESAGLVYKKRGAGTYVATQSTRYSDSERTRLLRERADAVAFEGMNLGFSNEEILSIVREQLNALTQLHKEQVEV